MKSKLSIKDYLPFLVIVLFVIAGGNLAAFVYEVYEPVAKGLFACAFLYGEYLVIFSSRRIVGDPIQRMFEYPGGFRFLGFGILLAFLNYWAVEQIFEMILYIAKHV